MNIFPAIVLSGALLFAGVAAGVSGYSLKSRATAGSDLSTASVRPSAASETTRTASEGPVVHSTEPCRGDGICNDYVMWWALHATP